MIDVWRLLNQAATITINHKNTLLRLCKGVFGKFLLTLHLVWRIYMKNIVSFLLILLAFNISSNAQNVDLSSVDEFLNITTLLKNGEEVNMEQWNQFDSSAAYSLFSNSKDNTILYMDVLTSRDKTKMAACSRHPLEQTMKTSRKITPK